MHRFTSEDGLPQNTIRAIAQDNNGAIWVATLAGLARFDGVHFISFDHGNTPVFSTDAFNAFAVDRVDGSLWIGGADGIYRYVKRRFEKAAGPTTAVFRLWAASQGGVWFDCGTGEIGRVRGKNILTWRYAPKDDEENICFVEDGSRDIVHFATTESLLSLNPDSGIFTRLPTPGWNGVRTALVAATNFWAGKRNALLHWENTNWPPLSAPETNATAGPIENLTLDRDGSIWASVGGHRLGQLRNGSIHLVEVPGFSPSEEIDCLHGDREGALWVGTKHGLVSLRPPRLNVLTERDGLLSDDSLGVHEGRDGKIFLTTTGGVAALQPGDPGLRPVAFAPSCSMAWTDLRGRLWIDSGGWKLWENGGLKNVLSEIARFDFHASSILDDTAGIYWFGINGALLRLDGREISIFRFPESDERAWSVRVLHLDHDGVLWLGTYGGGLKRFANGKFDIFRASGGEYENRMFTLYEDAKGVFWLGSANGLHRFEKGRFFSFHEGQGLPESVVNHVLEDDYGFLWLSGLKGIYRISKSQLNEVAAGRRERLDYLALGEADGMLSPESNGENGNSACKSRDGRLWFPTAQGVVVIEPRSFLMEELPPPVRIEEIRVDNRIVLGDGVPNSGLEAFGDSGVPNPAASELRLEAGQGSLVDVAYTANSFVAPAKIRFRYRLQGTSWIEARGNRQAVFPNLGPGHYHFEVIACNSHGVWQPVPTGFSFMIARHFYQTWVFYLLCGATLAGTGGWVQARRIRIRRRIAALEREAAVERERSRIARDLHDELGAGLARVVLLSDAQSARVRTEYRPQDVAREMMQKLDGIVWSLNPARADAGGVGDYLAGLAEQFIAPTAMQLRLDLPQTQPDFTLTSSQRHHLLLAFKEMLRNAVTHSQARTVTVRVGYPGENMEVGVRDDGIGFDPARRPPHRHGLANLAHRASDLGGTFELRTAPGQGTEAVIRFPCGNASALDA